MRPYAWPIIGFFLTSAGAVAEVLENSAIRVEFSSDNGSIRQIYDKRTGTEHIVNPKQVRLFQLMLPVIEERTRRILSWEQRATVTRTGENQIEIRYKGLQPSEEQYIFGSGIMRFPESRTNIEVTVTLRLEEDHLIGQIHVINNDPDPIPSVIFPYLGGMALKSASDSARIVAPSSAKRVLEHTSGVLTGEKTYRYPAVLATSWVSFELGEGSLAIEARSPLQAQDAWFSLTRSSFEPDSPYHGTYDYPFIAWALYPHIPGQSQWTSPEMRIHIHDSDWHRVAAEHREWQRASIKPSASQLWDTNLGFATYRLKRDDNTVDWKYEDLVKLADEAGQAGFKRIIIEGWREREGPGNRAPFEEIAAPELGGAAELKAAIAKLSGTDVELLFAFHPTLLNVFVDNYPQSHLNWGVKTSRQANTIPASYLFHSNDYPALLQTNQFKMEIDPATPATEYILKEATRLKNEYGIRNLLLKGVGQKAFLSYNRYHGVAPQDVYRVGYAKLLGGLRQIFKDGLLVNEGFNDLVNPFADAAYTWGQTHDAAILPYSIPWTYLSNDVDALDYKGANISFAHKALINLKVDAGRSTVTRYLDFVKHLRALQKLKALTVPYYAGAEFRDQEGLRNIDAGANSLVRIFVNENNKKTGIVVANLADEPTQIGFETAPSISTRKVTLFRQDASKEVIKPAGKIELDLQPYEIAILAIDN